MKAKLARVGLLAALVLVALFTLVGGTPAQAQGIGDAKSGAPPISVIAHDVPLTEQQATDSFWTAARRADAAPVVWLDEGDVTAPQPLAAAGSPAQREGTPPDPKAIADAQIRYPDEWKPRDGDPAPLGPDGTAGVFTRYPHNYYTALQTTYPNATIGKLYFTLPNGSQTYCTATVIGVNLVITAAHCTYTAGSGYHRNFMFVPAERYGARPFGQFTGNAAWVLSGWISPGTRNWDVSIVRLNRDSAGRNVSDYTGNLGVLINYPYVQSLHTIGYASNISTQYTSLCAAESYSGGSTDIIDMGCDMTYGSSGGPWIQRWGPFTAGYVDALVSGPGAIFGTTIRGPRLSSANLTPLCNTAGC